MSSFRPAKSSGVRRRLLAGVLAAGAAVLAAQSAGAEITPDQDVTAQDDIARQLVAALTPQAGSASSGPDGLPVTQWDHRPEAEAWTRAALEALSTYGAEVVRTVPRDIADWCPSYPGNPPELRRAFWVGLMSAIAHYESRHIPDVVGGANQYFGLMQIYPPTARSVGCAATTGEALRSGEANLACAVRIMAVVVPDHEAIAIHDGRWRGVANQWGPMTHSTARAEMAEWTRAQSYCQPGAATLAASGGEVPRDDDAMELALFAALPPELQAR